MRERFIFKTFVAERLIPRKSDRKVRFLTRGEARAYQELLQGQGNANESLAHS